MNHFELFRECSVNPWLSFKLSCEQIAYQEKLLKKLNKKIYFYQQKKSNFNFWKIWRFTFTRF